VRTNELHTNIVELSDIRKQKSNASSPYGPVKAGLTTSQTTLDQQLTELLSSLENVVESLNYKSFTVYDTLTTAIQGVRVALSDTATDVDGTDII
jgi:glutathionyl-hydroquinone reductase